MRLWFGYGSEHSMNLVMIGQFKSTGDAESAKQALDDLTREVQADADAGNITVGEPADRFSDRMLSVLSQVSVYDVRPAELEQFCYDVSISLDGDKIVLRTDESDVSAFLKVLLDRSARVEVFSAHDYPEARP